VVVVAAGAGFAFALLGTVEPGARTAATTGVVVAAQVTAIPVIAAEVAMATAGARKRRRSPVPGAGPSRWKVSAITRAG
jgi:hypothetical protein